MKKKKEEEKKNQLFFIYLRYLILHILWGTSHIPLSPFLPSSTVNSALKETRVVMATLTIGKAMAMNRAEGTYALLGSFLLSLQRLLP